MFDPTADPEDVARRAAELSLEQLDRLSIVIRTKGQQAAKDFYSQPWEIHISNKIAQLMGAYAVLKGHAPLSRAKIDK